MKIATWNVNSVKARLPTVLAWFDEAKPDVACLQEIKCVDDAFPRLEFEERGYNVETHGQKTYNGVALLSKYPIEDVLKGLPGDDSDEQARYLEAVIGGEQPVRVASIYLPNGNPIDSEKFDYKLGWFERLRARAKELLKHEEPTVIAGDYNVIPREDDVHDPKAWEGDALFRPESRAAWRALLNLGYADAFMAKDGRIHQYTFWDYQRGAWEKDHGIRIDHLACSPQALDALETVTIHRNARSMDKPSDHVPVVAEFSF
ncbi:MAG: exodeoxyribonuclease III [Maricaulaceae bacterium]|jgi:exodeoxyribonuclease-3